MADNAILEETRGSKTVNLDLHGKIWAEAKADFIGAYNNACRQLGRQALDVVHGYGSTGRGGVIRQRLRAFLDRYPTHLTYRPGEAIDNNPGHTLVAPLKLLPTLEDQLADEIWDYCSAPRPLSKIMGRFRRHGDPKVQHAIDELVSQHRLRRIADKVSRL